MTDPPMPLSDAHYAALAEAVLDRTQRAFVEDYAALLGEAEAERDVWKRRCNENSDIIDRLMAENDRLKVKLWCHGDKCSSECTTACSEMHTYESGCWFDALAPEGSPNAL